MVASLKQPDPHAEEKPDRKKRIREKVNLLLPDSLMIFLAVIMAPVVLVPIFVTLPASLDASFKVIDYTILGIFILEYVLKTVFARDVFKHIISPWHLLDLFIIVLPLVTLLPAFATEFGLTFPVLRLVRLARVFALGGRAIDRKIEMSATAPVEKCGTKPSSEVSVMDGTLENVYQDVRYDQLAGFLNDYLHTWIDISCVSEQDFDRLSEVFRIPRILLENELVDEAYPRVDYFDDYSLIYARIADLNTLNKGPGSLAIKRDGILVICQGQNIVTLSKSPTRLFSLILEKARKIHTPQEPAVVSILYTLLRHILDKDKQVISALEQALIALESIPFEKSPSNFLEVTLTSAKRSTSLSLRCFT